MTHLRYWIAATFGWLFAVYNVERIHEPINIASFVYVMAAVISIACVVLPMLRRISLPWMAVAVGGSFLLLKVWLGYPIAGSHLPITVTEACVLAVTVGLTWQLVSKADELEEVADHVALIDLDSTHSPFVLQQGEIYREIRRAREFSRPLALMTVSPKPQSIRESLGRFRDEIRQRTVKKFVHARLAEFLSKEVNHCDLVARRNGHFVVVLPETDGDHANQLVNRLKETAAEHLGLNLQVGLASLPDDELTFAGLLERAEAQMRGQEFQVVAEA